MIAPPAERRSRHLTAWAKAGLVATMIGVGLWVAEHGVVGTSWDAVTVVLGGVTAWQVVTLAVIWAGGLLVYSIVLAAALPGLGPRRALLLNLSGSAVANTVPLGGALATALNWRMVRTWGHSDRSFAAFCVLTNLLDVGSKLLLPLVSLAALLALSNPVPTWLWITASGCLAAGAALGLLLRPFSAARPAPVSSVNRWRLVADHLRDLGASVHGTLMDRWARLLPASIGYVFAQVLLLFLALRFVGLDAPVSVVLVAAALERLASLAPLTPGGAGLAEISALAWLVASGLDPAEAVAGVLLYRAFLIVMEIPVGAALLGAWVWSRRRRANVGPVGVLA